MLRINGHLRSLLQPGGRINQPWIWLPSKLGKFISSGAIKRTDLISESLCALKRRKGTKLPSPDQTSLGLSALPIVITNGYATSVALPRLTVCVLLLKLKLVI